MGHCVLFLNQIFSLSLNTIMLKVHCKQQNLIAHKPHPFPQHFYFFFVNFAKKLLSIYTERRAMDFNCCCYLSLFTGILRYICEKHIHNMRTPVFPLNGNGKNIVCYKIAGEKHYLEWVRDKFAAYIADWQPKVPTMVYNVIFAFHPIETVLYGLWQVSGLTWQIKCTHLSVYSDKLVVPWIHAWKSPN